MNYYDSKDGKLSLELLRSPTAETFNTVMEIRGCPIRVVPHETDARAVMLAAWDWLACEIKAKEGRTHG